LGQNASYPKRTGRIFSTFIPNFMAALAGLGPGELVLITFDGVAKSPPYGVTAFFQDLDIPDVCLRP
jgi:hypothetical protein